jgi:hypothetical protein
MKQRTQILFDVEDHRLARKRAAERGISLSEYVRQLVRSDGGATTAADASGLIGLGSSGGSDVARHKDEYIAEALEAHHPRR